eukprot:gene3821-6982_t
MVCVRVRPESNNEKTSSKRTKPIVNVVDEHVLVFDPSDESTKTLSSRERIQIGAKKGKDMKFAFDRVFGTNSSQTEVFKNSTKFLLPGVLNGYNATVFAHGATGSGKTHTMIGDERSGPGVLVLTIVELFQLIESSRDEKEYKIHVSYLEVYNEQIKDLLVDNSKILDLRCDSKKGMVVSGLTEHHPSSAEEALELLHKGNQKRVQFETAMNAQSSRSHAVFQIFVEQRDRTKNIKTNVKFGKLSLIDLAGNERASKTKNVGKRLQEGANINKSLLALGNCINALCKATTNSKTFIPYRDSKLTRLLKDSLGGNCRTVMIATVSPSSLSYEDTFNTLKYSDRAKTIKTKVERNELNVNVHISEYNNIINDLRNEVSILKKKLDRQDKMVETTQMNQFEKVFEEIEKPRSELLNSFDQQLEIRKRIMDFEEDIRKNYFEILKKQLEIKKWKQEQMETLSPNTSSYSPNSTIPFTISSNIKSFSKTIENCFQSNLVLQTKLKENISKCKYLEEKITTKFTHPQLSLIIEQDIKLHDGAVQRLDLERSLIHRNIMEQRLIFVKDSTKEFLNHQMSKIEIFLMEDADSNENSIDFLKLLYKNFEEFDKFFTSDQEQQDIIATPKKLDSNASSSSLQERRSLKKSSMSSTQKQIVFQEEPKLSRTSKSTTRISRHGSSDSTNHSTKDSTSSEDIFKKRLAEKRKSEVLKSTNVVSSTKDSMICESSSLPEMEKLSLEERRKQKRLNHKVVKFDIPTSDEPRKSSKPQPHYMSSTASYFIE